MKYPETNIISSKEKNFLKVEDTSYKLAPAWATASLTIMLSAANVDLHYKADIFQKVLSSNHWIILGCIAVGIILRKKFLSLIDRLHLFIFSGDREDRLMVIFGSNTVQHKMYLALIFYFLNAVLVFYLAKAFFIAVK